MVINSYFPHNTTSCLGLGTLVNHPSPSFFSGTDPTDNIRSEMLPARQIRGANLAGRPRLVRCHAAVGGSDTDVVSGQASPDIILRQDTSEVGSKHSLVHVTACDGSPARDRDVVHVSDEPGWGLWEIVEGVCRRGSLGVSFADSNCYGLGMTYSRRSPRLSNSRMFQRRLLAGHRGKHLWRT